MDRPTLLINYVYSVWPYQVKFSGNPNFFFTLGGSVAWTGRGGFAKNVLKIQEFNNLSKTHSSRYSNGNLQKLINLVEKVVKDCRFLAFFSTKTLYCTLDSLEAQKWGSKWNIIVICYESRFCRFLFGLGVKILGSEHEKSKTRSNSPKQALGALCGFDRVWWKMKTALTSDNTLIWRLKFGLWVQNESYSILFTHISDFETYVPGY
jgi:hypothetical protein